MSNQIYSAALVLLVATSSCLVNCQFLPQSHLGRLVQSITSPLVLSTGSSYQNEESDPYNSDPASGYYSGAGSEGGEGGAAGGSQQQQQQQAALQQAPSQQRGVPQQYYGAQDDERDQGSAPSNNKHTQDYQMGAYLGPTMDDKEINGAFNSNDERDDDDGPSSYEPGSGSGGRARAAASNSYRNNGGGGEGYGPAAGGYAGGRAQAQPGFGNQYQGAGYDEDGADEDEPPAHSPARGRRNNARPAAGYGRSGLSQAASFRQQQQRNGYQQQQQQPMMAAANGFSGYGFNGAPMDLNGLMGNVQVGGSDPGVQVFNGDGSYPGANYYQQQQQQPQPIGQSVGASGQRGGRNQQAASMNNGYYNNNQQPARAQAANEASQVNNDGDDADHDSDED